jgi:hypothetical protein
MAFLQQKLEYIHQNPVAKEWKLVNDRADYLYSSAGYYDYGRKPIVEITDINEWLMLNPSPSPAAYHLLIHRRGRRCEHRNQEEVGCNTSISAKPE